MGESRYQLACRVFERVADLPPQERARVITEACGEDAALRRMVEGLIAADDAPVFLDTPAVQGADDPDPLRADAPLPDRIGRFEVKGVLGEGGMGIVYRARQQTPEREVALKVLRSGLVGPSRVARFRLEADVLARLQHPGIARVYEAGTHETPVADQAYFAMELVEGDPISRFAADTGLDARERLALLARVCDAVDHAHLRGVVHRDLKPANILIDARGDPKVLDFGIARITTDDTHTTMHTGRGQLLGTLPYMSPEQVGGDPDAVDHRADVYALGVLGYELLAGHLPLDVSGLAIPDAATAIRDTDPTRLGTIDRALRGDIETIISTAMDKDPHRRYQSAGALRDDIERFLSFEPILARPATVFYQLAKFTRRNRGLVAGIASAFALLVLAAGGTGYGLVRASGQRDRAIEAGRQLDLALSAEKRAKDDALREASKARDVQAFLESTLTAANPLGRLGASGSDVTVRDMLDHAAAELEGFEGDPEVKASLLLTIGATYNGLGRYEQSEALLREAAASVSEAEGTRARLLRIDAERQLGIARLRQGFPGEAIALLESAHRSAQSAGDVPLASRAQGDLGLGYSAVGRYNDAWHHLTEAYEGARNDPDGSVEVVGSFLHNLAFVAMKMGDPTTAVEHYKAAIEAYGDGDFNAGFSHTGLGVVYQEMGDIDSAIAQHEQALRILDATLEPNHPKLGTALHNLAYAYNGARRSDQALGAILRALDIAETNVGKNSRDYVVSLGERATAAYRLGRFDEAADAWLTAGQWFTANEPRNPNGYLQVVYAYAVYSESDNTPERGAPIADAYDSLVSALGADHPHAEAARAEVALHYRRFGKEEEAARYE